MMIYDDEKQLGVLKKNDLNLGTHILAHIEWKLSTVDCGDCSAV